MSAETLSGEHSAQASTSEEAPVNSKQSLIVSLRIPYYLLSSRTLRQCGFKAADNTIWPYKSHKFRLGHDPWQGLGFPKPNPAAVHEVHRRLSEYHERFDFRSFVNASAHSAYSEAVVTIDKVLQLILAQNTGNENAIDTHSRLCNTFTYAVNGKKYAGKTPNWHEIRQLPIEELERALEPTGYHKRRAVSIKAVLDVVYDDNAKHRDTGLQNYEHDGNPPNAKDFVDGMLSMTYITDCADNSTEAVLGRLLALPGIGPKSASCIVAFQLKRPLFVVDTHVLRYTKWLGWIPRTCNDINLAAMYLHDVVPDEIKYDLHNQIWTHCAKENASESRGRSVLCPFCGPVPPSRKKLAQYAGFVCPVAEFLPPLNQRWPKRAFQEVEAADRSAARVIKQVGAPSPDEDVVTSKYFSSATQSSATKVEAVKVKAKKFKYLRTMALSDLTPYQAKSEGYLLWQFRPLDNSFGEAWGTFETLPRFKWEKPTTMDPEVAVTYEYAQDVLAGRILHPWSDCQ